mgnify:CR=1 FL=1
MHPIIGEKTLEDVAKIKSKWGIYSAPIWGKYDNFNRTLVIDAPEKTQIQRIVKRDHVSEEEAKTIIDNKCLGMTEYLLLQIFILNDSSIEDFERKLEFYFNFFVESIMNEKVNMKCPQCKNISRNQFRVQTFLFKDM